MWHRIWRILSFISYDIQLDNFDLMLLLSCSIFRPKAEPPQSTLMAASKHRFPYITFWRIPLKLKIKNSFWKSKLADSKSAGWRPKSEGPWSIRIPHLRETLGPWGASRVRAHCERTITKLGNQLTPTSTSCMSTNHPTVCVSWANGYRDRRHLRTILFYTVADWRRMRDWRECSGRSPNGVRTVDR